MAMRMAQLLPVLLLVLVLWPTCLHARSVPGDYDTAEYVPAESGGEEDPAPDSFDGQVFGETFTTQGALDIPDSSSTQEQSTYDYESNRFAEATSESDQVDSATDQEAVFVDSPETVQSDSSTSSFADDTALPRTDEVVYTRAQYQNDEVYFDTSSADTIYQANDDGLSLASTDLMNVTAADGELASLAKAMGGCGTGNPIDDCWRCDANWRSHRQALASCATGFGRNAVGGKNGPIYTVTSNADDTRNPQPGTLRYGVTRNGPLWIIFARSMTITLKGELWIGAYKTIDGRGAEVHIVGGSQVTIEKTHNVILHGLHIHDIEPSGPSTIRVSPTKVVNRGKSDGDGIHVWGSRDVWIDHCYLAKATDGLLDVTRGSSMVTISNNVFENHDKVILLGADGDHTFDRAMRVTVAFNKFGKGLNQRMPRCRFGVFHILNNDYSAGWGMYAIGGSEDPTILSQGNIFNGSSKKEVTKRINDDGPTYGGWQKWNWASSGDIFLNDAFFTGSGAKATSATSQYRGNARSRFGSPPLLVDEPSTRPVTKPQLKPSSPPVPTMSPFPVPFPAR